MVTARSGFTQLITVAALALVIPALLLRLEGATPHGHFNDSGGGGGGGGNGYQGH